MSNFLEVSGVQRPRDADSGYGSSIKTYTHDNYPDEGHFHEEDMAENTLLLNHPQWEYQDTALLSDWSSPDPSVFESSIGQQDPSVSSIPSSQHKYKATLEQIGELDFLLPSGQSEHLKTTTVYSEDSTNLARSDTKEFELELARDLRGHLSSFPRAGDAFSKTILPSRLAAFAQRLATEGSTQIHRNIMVLVHKHRRQVIFHLYKLKSNQLRESNYVCLL